MCEQAKTDWWNREKNNILNLLVNSDKLSSMMPLGLNKSTVINNENTCFTKTVLSKEEIIYAREMSKYVDSLLRQREIKETRSLFDILMHSESSPMNTDKYTELAEISRLVSRYCACRDKFHHSNLSEMRETDSALSKAMVNSALSHLEMEYCAYAQQYIDSTTRGISSNSDLRLVMAAFVEHHLLPQLDTTNLEDETVFGVPVWPLIFACLRAGLHAEAVQVAREASSNLGEFHALLDVWIDNGGTLPSEHARKLATEYKRHVRASPDGCKRLVYSLLAGCDNDDVHRAVLASVDDFMWLRLVQLRRAELPRPAFANSLADQQQQQCSLGQLQKTISEEYGENHFQAGQQPLTYCRILLLCQLFEPALAFLARFEQLRCHAVHLALLLWQRDLLLVAEQRPLEAPLRECPLDIVAIDIPAWIFPVSTDGDLQGLPRLNLARLVALYTRKFEASHPRDALDLFFVLRDLRCAATDSTNGHRHEMNGDGAGESVDGFVACASSLAVEGGQLELMFGTVADGDGTHQRAGLLARYGSAVAETVLRMVSCRLRDGGRLEAACDALQLAGRFQEAATDLAELLVGCVALPVGDPSVARLQAKAEFVLARTPQSHEAAVLACVLSVARFVFSSGDRDVEAALAALDRTELLPTASDAGSIRSATETFRNLPEIVRSLFPALLVSAMRTLRTVTKVRQHSHESLVDIRRRAAALITFTGQLPYRMPSEVYASLSQLELEIS